MYPCLDSLFSQFLENLKKIQFTTIEFAADVVMLWNTQADFTCQSEKYVLAKGEVQTGAQ